MCVLVSVWGFQYSGSSDTTRRSESGFHMIIQETLFRADMTVGMRHEQEGGRQTKCAVAESLNNWQIYAAAFHCFSKKEICHLNMLLYRLPFELDR